MQIAEIIKTYLKGWEFGDGELSLSVTADNFYYDDPNSGRIARKDFVDFVNDFKRAAVEMGGEENAKPFLNYSDTVIKDDSLPVTVWCWHLAGRGRRQGAHGVGEVALRLVRVRCLRRQTGRADLDPVVGAGLESFHPHEPRLVGAAELGAALAVDEQARCHVGDRTRPAPGRVHRRASPRGAHLYG